MNQKKLGEGLLWAVLTGAGLALAISVMDPEHINLTTQGLIDGAKIAIAGGAGAFVAYMRDPTRGDQ